jgi:uncharacterized protein (DUF1501 family)
MGTNRREFLISASRAAAGCAALQAMPQQVSGTALRMIGAWEQANSDAIVVVVNLNGGNDGLNTVVPISDAQYGIYERLRPKLKIRRDAVLRLSDNNQHGLNPAMAELRDLYESGKVAIVAGVGVPQDSESKFDHAAGIYDFVSADPYHVNFHSRPTGWLGRAIDGATPGVVPPGVNFGGGDLLLLGRNNKPLSLASISDVQVYAGDIALSTYLDIMKIERRDSPVAELNRSLRRQAIETGGAIREMTRNYQPKVQYPAENILAEALLDVARVIWANLGARGFSVALGGFDTHKQQDGGNFHFRLLKLFSDAVSAFYRDLRAQGLSQRVVIVTISDFGRRPEENVDRGTDHGYANVCFVIGDKVKKGMWGEYPSLEREKLVFDQNLNVTTDYRSVFATILARHLDVDPMPVVGVSQTLGFM